MRRSLLFSSAVVLILLSGCTTQTTGTPAPTEPRPATSRTSSGPENAVKPCELLPDSTHQALGITGQPKPRQITRVTWCDWRVRKDSAADSYTISVGYYPAPGLKDLRTVTAGV
ncbi:DUF3558 family protein [Actinokineospora globicatena]|uniref:DUF3558 family protein n=1 Tax=Actinokineospora globicatena TaxID=103729 RepID=UPI003D7FBB61